MEPQAPRRAPTPVPTPQHGYALRFISGKYQGGEFPLPINREIVVGRSSELDMVLVEDMVSRRHAKIIVSDGDIASDFPGVNLWVERVGCGTAQAVNFSN